MDRALGLRNAMVGMGSANVPGEHLVWAVSGSVLGDGRGWTIHHGVPGYDLVVVHKVNIDVDGRRNITEPTYMTMLGLVLDAKCDKKCHYGTSKVSLG